MTMPKNTHRSPAKGTSRTMKGKVTITTLNQRTGKFEETETRNYSVHVTTLPPTVEAPTESCRWSDIAPDELTQRMTSEVEHQDVPIVAQDDREKRIAERRAQIRLVTSSRAGWAGNFCLVGQLLFATPTRKVGRCQQLADLRA
jgi:hypothetical protein